MSISDLDRKITYSSKIDFERLQSVSLYAHDSAESDIRNLKSLEVDSSGNLKITGEISVASGHGLATEVKQDDQITKLTEIDNVLDTMNGKFTFGSEDSISGNLQQNLVYGRFDNNGDLKAMKVSSDGSLITAPAGGTIITSDGTLSEQRVMILGNHNGNLRTIKCGDNGEMNVGTDHSWDNSTTLWNLVSCSAGQTITSSTFDLGQGVSHELGNVEFFLTNSASVDVEVVPEVSYNGTVWYFLTNLNSVSTNKQYSAFSQEEIGIGIGHRYMRFQLTNNDATNLTNITLNVGYYK